MPNRINYPVGGSAVYQLFAKRRFNELCVRCVNPFDLFYHKLKFYERG